METEQKFFVYVDYREDNGKPFYVGKGVEKRVKDLQRNFLHTRIKNKHGMVRKIVLETQSEQESFEKEIQLIQELKTHVDFDEGGANLTLGGDGVSGYKYTDDQKEERSKLSKKMWENPEFKERMSELIRKMWEDPEFKEKFKQICNSPERREKKGESLKKFWENHPEQREMLSVKQKECWEDPERREKGCEAIKKTWENPEHREKIRKATKKRWEDPEQREKLKVVFDSPEFKEKVGKSSRKRWEDPEFRAKHLEACKKAIEKRSLRNSS